MTDAAKEPNRNAAQAAAAKPPLFPEGYNQLLEDEPTRQLSAIVAKYPAGIILRELATHLEVQSATVLENDPDSTDFADRQNALLQTRQAARLRTFTSTF